MRLYQQTAPQLIFLKININIVAAQSTAMVALCITKASIEGKTMPPQQYIAEIES
jgi:hypothetical protein